MNLEEEDGPVRVYWGFKDPSITRFYLHYLCSPILSLQLKAKFPPAS